MAYRFASKLNSILKPACYRHRELHVSAASFKLVQFVLSDIGEGIKEVTIKDWFVKVGDNIAQFDDVCLVESDKASVNITSRYDGTVKQLHYNVGDVALIGKPLMDIDSISDQIQCEEKDNPSDKPIVHIQQPQDQDIDKNKALAAPSVRRIAKENNITLSNIKASGKGGRVMKEDILNYIDSLKGGQPVDKPHVPPPPKVGMPVADKVVPITGVKKAMVSSMTRSGAIPAFGYCDEISVSELIELRATIKEKGKAMGINITYMPFFIKALSKALEQYPQINASVDEKCENITYKAQHNIGFAMDTRSGLIVPNIKNVKNLSIMEIAIEMNRITESGKKGRVIPSDLSGGTITISNIGMIGGTYFSPLINPPEIAIVALGKVQNKIVLSSSGQVKSEKTICASWAGDHRVIDGATMARFATLWKEYVEKPTYLLVGL